MENSYLAPWTLSSNSSSDGAERPIVADQRSSKRCKVQTHVVDLSGLQLMQQRETSTTFVERAKSPTQVRSTSSFDRKTMKNDEKILEDKDVQVVWQPICSIILKNDTKNSEQQEMDPEIISRLVEMAESDARLGQLVEVLFSGEASVSEREEWNRYYNSLSSSASPLDAEQFEKYTSPIVAPRKTPKVIPISFETPRASPPSNVTSFHISGHVANELSPPYSPIARQHDRLPTESPQEDEIVFLHERLRTPPKQAGALDGAGVANAPLYISPERAVVVKKSSVVPVADPFAQAKRKRAQAEAEIKKRLKTSKIIVSEEVKVVTQPIVQTSTSSVSRGSASLQILSVKVQNLEDCIAEYQAELQRKNAKIQDLSTEVEREKSSPRLSLRKAKQQIASLKGDLEESQRAARRAQTKVRELRSKMERMPRPISDNVPATASATQDVTNIELSNLRSEVSALRSLVAAKDKPHPKYEFVHRNLFLAPLVLCERPRTVSERSRGRPPKSTSSHTESDEDEEEATNLTRNERALRKFDKAIGLPQDPIPVRVDGMLAYRDGTRDVNGRLPRAKTLFKVGRNVPGELM
ncbi:hypothetical protein MMC17_002169 [Xylographa soralifera]|nr:hypothetical protein [Xylographa soralifera]